ncbi:sensor histidine kinase [Umezakia ovalisporum]|uniref:histidine kinase n=2 Tax=Umezakia ovalisporum TaxID=75695 RepID=A0AA43GVR9_9CYAN|nr:ATP-binding protein [Umezakia ovalisporum]MDH6056087.1 GAF domain-containing protein [Umezakia ovalisporum FSS-43]MDH6062530.1 GAF domain-containing protein [Umezakia ovalisporum FSS-62]MDH6068272.1 GAF domain-containing protein [Umezakia ovalisporum APH033B]MDH6069873.1 GAF domain-containing protein [Umezakia ovalisporum CobakiLakeA]MDH6074290.1 GAF domain-containing protein [Umezakia ovalisporum CS-1034]
MSINNIPIPSQFDISNCNKEPIHIPGFIQPHGVIIVLKETDLTILQVSDNTLQLFGVIPEKLLNQNLSYFLESEQIIFLKDCLNQQDLPIINPIEFTININNKPTHFDGIIHRYNGLLILELEPTFLEKNNGFFKFYHLVKVAMSKLQIASSLAEVSQIIVQEVKRITGFDRVMLYRFDENWNGKVIAEEKPEYLTPYLGLHYPASDIPTQARKLYTENWLRLIPNTYYEPAAILPRNNPLTDEPLDLSRSVLRSVSPLHLEYMHNMGVMASMSISIIKNEKLWGLIACHHQSPKYIPYEIRNACEFLGQMTSLEMAAKEGNEDVESKIEVKSCHSKLVEYMSSENNFIDALINQQPNLLNLVNAQGAAVCFHGKCFTIGNSPEEEDIHDLVAWISHNHHEDIFYTDSLAEVYPEAEKLRDVASGLMVLSISKTQKNYILWFRPEVVRTVNWGGNPNKPVEIKENGSIRLSPRKSFELWKETVLLKSLPWKSCEVNAALELRSAIIAVVLRKADELAQLNVELQRSNHELDAFAYIASHDLKEPLRGIHNYSNFLIEDYGDTINEEGRQKLKTLIRLTQRMEDLIDSLLHFSRLGRVDLSMQLTDLNDVLHRSLDFLSARIEEMNVDIQIPRPLPKVYCDGVQVGEVFNNLIANSIKYNDKPDKWILIGYIDQPSLPITFYVRDNGIGIRDKHFEAIFRIFKRLHGPSKYGGGTGAGLTIAKKIVERHGGKIWVESTYGEGSTFYFTLQPVE